MLKKTITYVDYNGTERTEDFYFNLNKAELVEMQMSEVGGLGEALKRIVAAQDTPALAKAFKDIILRAYGEKSPDGRQFIKNEQLSTAFSQTEAYSNLYIELMSNNGEGFINFVNLIMPADLAQQVAAEKAKTQPIN